MDQTERRFIMVLLHCTEPKFYKTEPKLKKQLKDTETKLYLKLRKN